MLLWQCGLRCSACSTARVFGGVPSVADLTITMITPVYNGGAGFQRCLAAVQAAGVAPDEWLVVDDGSTDVSARWAQAAGAEVLTTASPASGPAVARNLAAQHATGDLLFFCDADIEIRPDTLAHIRRTFAADRGLTALFGSYDDQPGDPDFISQYKNLFHHYVHQRADADASTFWGGCGVIRREVFLQLGGFSPRYTLPSIEDIELGYLLKRHGYRICLDNTLQVKHLKRWTFTSLLHSDILARGIPWTELIWRERAFLNDLNLQTHNRVSVATTYLGLGCGLPRDNVRSAGQRIGQPVGDVSEKIAPIAIIAGRRIRARVGGAGAVAAGVIPVHRRHGREGEILPVL